MTLGNSWRMGVILISAVLLACGAAVCEDSPGGEAPAPPAPPQEKELRRAGPGNVLVVYNSASPGDKETAEYYASRRGIPAGSLLGLDLPGMEEGTNYQGFFTRILTPVREKLHSLGPDGKPLSESILYILLSPGMPVAMNTRHEKQDHPMCTANSASWRSVDGWLFSIEQNFAAGIGKDIPKPAPALKRYPLAVARAGGKFIAHYEHGGGSVADIVVACRKLGEHEFTEEGKLGDLVVDGTRLGAAEVGAGDKLLKLVDIELKTDAGPVKLGDVELRHPPLGSLPSEIRSPVGGAFVKPQPASFAELRAKSPELAGFYLVTRLGADAQSARRAVDGAIYAERYLRGGESPRLSIWLDQKFGFAGDQVAAQVRCSARVQPSPDGFKADAKGPLAPWPLVIDNQSNEIGMKTAAGPHRPTATAKVAAVGEGRLVLEKGQLFGRDVPMSIYFAAGEEIRTAGGAKAVVKWVDVAGNRLAVSSTEGFRKGDEITWTWPGEYPAADCFFFFGFYGLGQYEDVFAFPPGAIGIHVDSACMTWARRALDRGIAGTYGVTTEPFSAGIPYGDTVLSTLARGGDLAEAFGSSTTFGQRWMGVVFGDPLYAPFRGEKIADTVKPVVASVSAAVEEGGLRVRASLGGKSPDELAEVALFRVEYGETARHGRVSDFYDWPEPENPGKVAGRNYSGYSREMSRLLTGLEAGKAWHYRVVARDPAGNESASADGVVKLPRSPAAKK